MQIFKALAHDDLCDSTGRAIQNSYTEVHNYNDVAKTRMQNFIYILIIKGQSDTHKTVYQILLELQNFDLI